MSSDDSPDLPVAGRFTLDRQYEQGIIWNNDVVDSPKLEEGDELVKKSDAEEAIKEAREQERQRILDEIEEIESDLEDIINAALATQKEHDDDSWKSKRDTVRVNCYDLARSKLKELRDDLQQEQEEEVDA